MGKTSKMKADEMQILKATSIKLSDDVLLLATYQYHVEENPETGKTDKSKSIYRWVARVCSIPALKEKIKELASLENRLNPWFWPNDPSWNGKTMTTDSTNYCAAKWLSMKLSKAVSWEEGLKILKGWNTKRKEEDFRCKYEVEGYLAADGSQVSLLNKDDLLNRVGQNFLKVIPLKNQIQL